MQEANQPSTANIALACAILAGVTGYFLGTAKSLGLFGGSPISESPRKQSEKKEEEEDTSDDESSDDNDEDDDTAPAEFPGHTEECKMVLVVRTDLGMTKGM
jgi:PTH2 family peptidyl-tRNA hydrolase